MRYKTLTLLCSLALFTLLLPRLVRAEESVSFDEASAQYTDAIRPILKQYRSVIEG